MTRALRPAKALLAHLDMLAHRERLPEQLAALATLDINRLLAGATLTLTTAASPDPTAAYTPVGLHNPDQGRAQVQ